ncbi:hypothetical protein ACHAAC_15615 [Aeromicrobium sp. CF4.19]|uniref:hypothetical protein n=1 Tax=Aeromicrobium sp. CF4.19 TaxID=3373082 RepID=UPI003EE6B37E
MHHSSSLVCTLEQHGHHLSFIQLKLALGLWKRHGIGTSGLVIALDPQWVDVETGGGRQRLFLHETSHLADALASEGPRASLLDHGVLVVGPAIDREVFIAPGPAFSVATEAQWTECLASGTARGPHSL